MKFRDIQRFLLFQEYDYVLGIRNGKSLILPFIQISSSLIAKFLTILFNIIILSIIIIPGTVCGFADYVSVGMDARKKEELIEEDETEFFDSVSDGLEKGGKF